MLGKMADPSRYFTGKTEFNDGLVSSEWLLMDDKQTSRSSVARATLGGHLKSISAGSEEFQHHAKGKDEHNVSPIFSCCICTNSDSEALGALPYMGEGESDSLRDKIVMFECNKHPLPYSGNPNQKRLVTTLFAKELPGFAYFIDNYVIPDSIKTNQFETDRYGFDSYQSAKLLDSINANSNERTLLSLTDDMLFSGIGFDELETDNRKWEGTAEDWANAMLNHSSFSFEMKKFIIAHLSFGDRSKVAGHQLKKMEKVSEGRITRKRSSTTRLWVIHETAPATKENSQPEEDDCF
jgi:hypothetical protein